MKLGVVTDHVGAERSPSGKCRWERESAPLRFPRIICCTPLHILVVFRSPAGLPVRVTLRNTTLANLLSTFWAGVYSVSHPVSHRFDLVSLTVEGQKRCGATKNQKQSSRLPRNPRKHQHRWQSRLRQKRRE